jgi:hypothetical protein
MRCHRRTQTTTYGWRGVCPSHGSLGINFDAQGHTLNGFGTTTRTFSGRVGSEHLPDLRRSVEEARELNLVLDLCEVRLVDVDVVRFLVDCETQGVRLAHCPAYICEWMGARSRLRDRKELRRRVQEIT